MQFTIHENIFILHNEDTLGRGSIEEEIVLDELQDYEDIGNRTLFFMSQNPEFGSVKMRGHQIIDEWKSTDSSIYGKNGPKHWKYGIKKCWEEVKCADICVFIGPCHSTEYPRESCCKLKVLDVVDKYLYHREKIDSNLHDYDALIVNNNYMKNYFQQERNFTGEILVLLHHSDPRWHSTETKTSSTKSLRFGYSGSLPSLNTTDNFLHLRDVKDQYPITLVDTDKGIIPEVVDFRMDLSVRPVNTEVSQFKTSAKVATAAALGHNIITTHDEAVKDSLPDDYPFILRNSSLEALREMMDKAIEDYAGDQKLWKKGLDIMKGVNERLSVPNIAYEYHRNLVKMFLQYEKKKDAKIESQKKKDAKIESQKKT